MKKPPVLLFTFIALLLAGCAGSPQRQVQAPASHPGNELIVFALHYGGLAAEDQRKEYNRVMQAYGSDKLNLGLRMKAALAMSLPGSRQRDNVRALALLDGIQHDGSADADTRALAALLKEYIGERQKLEENAARATLKAADERKRADGLQSRAEDLQQKAEALQQKLDELKNIEKTLINREQSKQK